METTILLARHGETDWNLERRIQGHSDRPLNETGRSQARELAQSLEAVALDAVYSSDLARAFETAAAVAEPRGLTVNPLPELREKNFGSWEGLTDEEAKARFPVARNGPWGDGETTEQLAERVLAALRAIASRHAGERVLVVSHGGAVRAVLRHCKTASDGQIGNCHVVQIGVRGEILRWID